MATKAFKEQKIAHIKDYAQKAKVAIVTNYKGLTVEEITNLRRALQKEGADYTVTKNTLAKILALIILILIMRRCIILTLVKEKKKERPMSLPRS